jgi:hypothetical protein
MRRKTFPSFENGSPKTRKSQLRFIPHCGETLVKFDQVATLSHKTALEVARECQSIHRFHYQMGSRMTSISESDETVLVRVTSMRTSALCPLLDTYYLDSKLLQSPSHGFAMFGPSHSVTTHREEVFLSRHFLCAQNLH